MLLNLYPISLPNLIDMSNSSARTKIEGLLSQADIQLNGTRAWDIQVHDQRLFSRVLAEGSLGFGEAYMDGWWDCRRIDELIYKVFRAELDQKFKTKGLFFEALKARLFNLQSPARAFIIGQRHYDIGNDLYRNMLDPLMIYSCGYWKDAETLEEAQKAKLDLVCRKLNLEPGMRVLDIGCGWGGTAKYAVVQYGVSVVGLTVSQQQANWAQTWCKDLPVEIKLEDYRDHHEEYDRILSIGMFEHVGNKNYPVFMDCVLKNLKPEGLFLLHTIGKNRASNSGDPWIDRYIFPNSILPSPKQIGSAIDNRFVLEDWHNFGSDYDKTLMAWFENFDNQWESLKSTYDERFYRMWKYYLLACAGSFRARKNQVWQLLLSPKGIQGGIQVPR